MMMLASAVAKTSEDSASSEKESLGATTQRFLKDADPQTDALVRVWATMLDDELVRRRAVTTLNGRKFIAPEWIKKIDEASPVRVLKTQSVLHDDETLFIEISTAQKPFVLAVSISLLGTPYLEDSYPTGGNIKFIKESITAEMAELLELSDLSLPDAAARIREALKHSDQAVPAVQTGTWPASRPLLEWVLRMLPAKGGVGYQTTELSEQDIDQLVAEFMASPNAEGFGAEEKHLAEVLFRLQSTLGPDDPLRWSGMFIQRLLTEIIPQQVEEEETVLRKIPDVLRALASYANTRSGIASELAQEVLEVIDEEEEQFLASVSEGAPESGPAPDTNDDFDSMADGAQDLLPQEELTTSDLEDDIVSRVQEIADEAREAADAFFKDPEMTTATVRVLHAVAVNDPGIFRRRFKNGPTVGALCLIAGRINNWFNAEDPEKTVRALTQTLELKTSPTSRAQSLTTALGEKADSEELLTSTARAERRENT